jgi:hypothetical protein
MGSVALVGPAFGDLSHLLSELIDNALSFSPPHTTVEVKGQRVGNGLAIEIEDRGLGMSDEKFAAANERITSERELNLATADKLGLYVVSRLAARQGVRVSLIENVYRGTTAVVVIPSHLITDQSVEQGAIGSRHGAPETRNIDPGELQLPEPPNSAAEGAHVQRVDYVTQRPTSAAAAEGPNVQQVGYAPPRLVNAPAHEVASHQYPPPTPPLHTAGGLPVRKRQANLNPKLVQEGAATGPRPVDSRSPDEVYRRISNYRDGAIRGRAAVEGAVPSPPSTSAATATC